MFSEGLNLLPKLWNHTFVNDLRTMFAKNGGVYDFVTVKYRMIQIEY